MKVFLDTNIIIDVMERREPFFLQSANILELGYRKEISLYATSLSFINALYISRKNLDKDIALGKVKTLRECIYISPISEKEFDLALSLEGKDIEDNLQYSSASSSGCNIIITRNKKDFPIDSDIMIMTPQEFIDYYTTIQN